MNNPFCKYHFTSCDPDIEFTIFSALSMSISKYCGLDSRPFLLEISLTPTLADWDIAYIIQLTLASGLCDDHRVLICSDIFLNF